MDFTNERISSFGPQEPPQEAPSFHNPFGPQHPENTPYNSTFFYPPQGPQEEAAVPQSNISNAIPQDQSQSSDSAHAMGDYPQFDIFEWYPRYQSCQRYFLERAQYSGPVQAVAAFINIRLPFMCDGMTGSPPRSSPLHGPSAAGPANNNANNGHDQTNSGPFSFSPSGNNGAPTYPSQQPTLSPPQSISLIPYLRRLVVTGLDFPGVLHGLFGDDWASGIGPLHEQERRNYLFAAKSGGWASVKRDYDLGIGGGGGGGGSTGGRHPGGSGHPATGMAGPATAGGGMAINDETVPFMRQLQNPKEAELRAAEKAWSEWLLMEDWLIGPRAPVGMREGEEEGTDHHEEGAEGGMGGEEQRHGSGQAHERVLGIGETGVTDMR